MPNQKMHYTYFNIARNYHKIKIVLKTKVGKQTLSKQQKKNITHSLYSVN